MDSWDPPALVTCSTVHHFCIQQLWLLCPEPATHHNVVPTHHPEPPSRHLLKQHQMRTPRYFSYCAFLWNLQQNKPSLPVCLFTVAKPNHTFWHSQMTQPSLPQRKSHGEALVLCTVWHTFSPKAKSSISQSTTSLIKKSYLDFSCLISNYYWP